MSTKFDLHGVPNGSPLLDAAVTAVAVLDNDGNPNLALDQNDGFRVQVDWGITGTAVPLFGGTWTVRAFLESMGPGPEFELAAPINVSVGSPVSSGINFANYRALFTIPPGVVPGDSPARSGIYKLVILVTHRSAINGAKTRTAGFGDEQIIEVHQP